MKNDSKITITIEKENNLNEILDEIIKLKEQEKEVNKIARDKEQEIWRLECYKYLNIYI